MKVPEDVSPPSLAKVPKSCVANFTIPPVSDAEGLIRIIYEFNKTSIYDILQHLMVLICLVETERSNERYDNDNKQNIRASSIPPPRAVISSPGIFTKPPFFFCKL